MKRHIFFILVFAFFSSKGISQQAIFYESFDGDTVLGVKGSAKCFDGYFTNKDVAAALLPSSKNFTVQTWIAVQEYATNVAAIVDKEYNFKTGYLLGINQYGQLSASVAVNDTWLTVVSSDTISLLKWTHVAMSLDNGKAITLFINGKKSGSLQLNGNVTFCDSCNLSIGKTQTKTTAANTERATSAFIKTNNRFDGLMDELSIQSTVLSEAEIANSFASILPTNPQPLQFRQMPSGPSGNAKFGAYYTKLKYSPGWDALWRGSDYPDIIVRFDNNPVRFLFWRGTGYIPAIVNEKNMWMTDQSLEHWGTGECYEAMGDKQTRYSHVRIIENTSARVVVHWRYALTGIKHQFLPEDENGWGDWVDEYWTIYPDGLAARKQVLWSNRYEKDKGSMQWQETIFFCQPGTKPQDNVDMKALTLMDLQGNKETYSWENGPPKLKMFNKPKYQPIEYINFKAEYKPFSIFDEKRICQPFSFGNMKGYTTFPNWNHWPVQQVASDGRNAVAPDKPSHTSLTGSNGNMQIVEKKSEGCYWGASLKGMTNQPIDSLLTVAKSWNYPATMSNMENIGSAVYDKYQRAYVLTAKNPKSQNLSFIIEGSATSPIVNLPIVIENWHSNILKISINGKLLKANKDFTIGNIDAPDSNKLVAFIRVVSNQPLKVKFMSN